MSGKQHFNILIFSGTTEGRKLVEYLKDEEVTIYVSSATEYGSTLIEKSRNVIVLAERLDKKQIEELIKEKKIDFVIDATHPYAREVSVNVKNACADAGIEYLRLTRESEKGRGIYVKSTEEAAEYLKKTKGNIFVTTGSKELSKFTEIENYKERITARVLSLPEVVEECSTLGFKGKNLICMQGPFSEEINYEMFKNSKAEYLVTKESGKNGGFKEKINAAERLGMQTIIIGRPQEDEGVNFEKTIEILNKKYNLKKQQKVYLIGIGMGTPDTMTVKAEKLIKNSDILIGASRMTEALKKFNKPVFNSYKYDEIKEFIENNKQYTEIAVVYSGDTGFYSGAKKMAEILSSLKDVKTEMICGISSPVYFCSKINTSWDDVKLVSMHGRELDIIKEIKHNKKVFSLLSGKDTIKNICEKLIKNGLEYADIVIGENLSYENERIILGKPKDFLKSEFQDLTVMLIINSMYDVKDCEKPYRHLKDEEFIRAKVPMTKEEIRALSVIKLDLEKDSVLYDIGAGTGSVSIEAASNCPYGKVYAVEKNEEAVSLLEKNKLKFNLKNIEIIKGRAPEELKSIESPTHVFIGGSSGNLKSILSSVFNKNPETKVVINAVTLETVSEAVLCTKEFNVQDVDISQVTVAKARKAGRYNLMAGQNPIYIISFKGIKSDVELSIE